VASKRKGTAEEEAIHLPPDVELEADFDPHEAPTKPGAPPGLSDEILDVRDDLRRLVSVSAVLFEQVACPDAVRHTARIGEARFALAELAKKYGVTT